MFGATGIPIGATRSMCNWPIAATLIFPFPSPEGIPIVRSGKRRRNRNRLSAKRHCLAHRGSRQHRRTQKRSQEKAQRQCNLTVNDNTRYFEKSIPHFTIPPSPPIAFKSTIRIREQIVPASRGMGEHTAAHVLMLSFPGQGHVNPLLRLAKRVAAKGLLVTISSSMEIGHKIYEATGTKQGEAVAVGEGELRFEFFSIDEPRGTSLDELMNQLKTVWPRAVAELIRCQAQRGRPVSCVVGNPFLPWSLDIAAEMDIPSAVLWVQSCAVFSTYYHYHHSLAEFPTETNPDISVSLPGLPTMKAEELPTFLLPSNPYKSLKEAVLGQFHNLEKATWVLVNSFEELEHDVFSATSKLSPLIPVGPLIETDESQSNIRGDLWKAADCMEWMDAQEPRSVVYVSLGSLVILSQEEMAEMAHGLRASTRPFLWVVRDDCRALLPEGFVKETEKQGMVVPWSPQDRVLAHCGVACFVTHCGWNSTLEAISSGVPVVAYPQWGDQVPDAKFLVDVYGVGVRLKAPVMRDELVRCVEEVTSGAGAEEMRRRAAGWKEAAWKAVAEGGSSDRNIQAFVDEVRGRTCSSGGAGKKP